MAGQNEGSGRFLDRLEKRFSDIDAALVEQRQYTEFAYARLDAKIDAGFARMDDRFAQMDERFARMDERFAQMDGRFTRLERKLDAFIDTQMKANELVERRLRLLEAG